MDLWRAIKYVWFPKGIFTHLALIIRDVCPSSQKKFSEGAYFFGNKFDLVTFLIWCEECFPNEKFEEEAYMTTTLGFRMPNAEGKTYKLNKTLYGLKQAQSNHTLFVRRLGPKMIALIVFVDDIVVIR